MLVMLVFGGVDVDVTNIASVNLSLLHLKERKPANILQVDTSKDDKDG